MKPFLYIAAFALLASSCSTTRNFSSTVEDDIYYVPGKKALVIQEVENLTGQDIDIGQNNDSKDLSGESYSSTGSTTPPASFSPGQSKVVNTKTGKLENVDLNTLTGQAAAMLADNDNINETIYENTGYWIGGYKGSENDLDEIQRIINMYPQGFAYFNSNGQDIAMNLSFDPDWNVYTDNGRYWWFPSSSNINLYSSLLFGNYPKYIWTVVWDNPGFDSWAFDDTFNNRFAWNLNVGVGSPGWSLGFGWNSGRYDPWYNGWYGGWYNPWNNPWYNPWYSPWYGYYPGWGYPNWHHPHWNHPHWNHPNGGGSGYYPNGKRPITGLRPNNGGGVTGGLRPNRPASGSTTRPGVTNRPTRPNNTSGMVRPNTSTRPGSSTTRPNVRPNSSSVSRPGSTVTRPGSITRPSGTTTRPSSVTRPTTTTRPATRPTNTGTRPSTVTRPGNSGSRYTRPSSSGNVKNYTRPQSSYRPTYNNNSSSRYNSGSSSRPASSPTRSSSGSSYSPSRSSGSTVSPNRSSGGNGGGSRPVSRPVRR